MDEFDEASAASNENLNSEEKNLLKFLMDEGRILYTKKEKKITKAAIKIDGIEDKTASIFVLLDSLDIEAARLGMAREEEKGTTQAIKFTSNIQNLKRAAELLRIPRSGTDNLRLLLQKTAEDHGCSEQETKFIKKLAISRDTKNIKGDNIDGYYISLRKKGLKEKVGFSDGVLSQRELLTLEKALRKSGLIRNATLTPTTERAFIELSMMEVIGLDEGDYIEDKGKMTLLDRIMPPKSEPSEPNSP